MAESIVCYKKKMCNVETQHRPPLKDWLIGSLPCLLNFDSVVRSAVFLLLSPTSNMNLPVTTVVGQPAFSRVSWPTLSSVKSELVERASAECIVIQISNFEVENVVIRTKHNWGTDDGGEDSGKLLPC